MPQHRNILSKYKLNFALRINKQNTGTKMIHGTSDTSTGLNENSIGYDQQAAGSDASRQGQFYETHSDTGPVADNDDVYKVRFVKRGMTRLKRVLVRIRRWWRAFMVYVGEFRNKKLSTDEKFLMLIRLQRWNKEDLEDHRKAREFNKLFRLHRAQAKLVGNQIVDVLTNLKFSHFVMKDDRVYVKQRIKFKMVDVSPYAYVYHIQRTPHGVKKTDMSQDWVATEIASTIGKKIRHELDLNGLRYTVEIGSTLSIPNFVSFDEFDFMPSTMPPLAFYCGQTTNGVNVYRNLADAPHMIVAGQTGGGKSNELNGIICGLLKRNDESVVKLTLFDLKGGVEFAPFYGIPHLWTSGDDRDGIVEYPEKIVPALKAVMDECNRRLGLLKKSKTKNIAEYNRNRHPSNKLPYLVGIFDEYTTARKLAGAEVETLLSTIANLSRAAGIHFILGTQYPKAEILSTLISVNFPWRLAFNMTTGASQSVLSSWDAVGLTPTGRAILQTSEGQIMLQTPRITESTITQIVTDAKNKTNTARVNTVDAKEIIEWVINYVDGGTKMDEESVWNRFKERITQRQLRDLLRSMESKEFDINGVLYTVRPGNNYSPRRLEAVNGARTAVEMTGDVRRAEEIAENKQINHADHEGVTRDEPVTETENN
jgi:S-DNA-T family DNA segregation ATPase FtsK/SpoIIIE